MDGQSSALEEDLRVRTQPSWHSFLAMNNTLTESSSPVRAITLTSKSDLDAVILEFVIVANCISDERHLNLQVLLDNHLLCLLQDRRLQCNIFPASLDIGFQVEYVQKMLHCNIGGHHAKRYEEAV
jgi:hypothetical protein